MQYTKRTIYFRIFATTTNPALFSTLIFLYIHNHLPRSTLRTPEFIINISDVYWHSKCYLVMQIKDVEVLMRDNLIIPRSLEEDDLLLKQFDNVKKKKESNVTKTEDNLKKCIEEKNKTKQEKK